MCGIAGFAGPGTRGDLAAMCAALVHRGPDAEGAWFEPESARPVGLGFRRLTILDSVGGAQPMADSAGRFVVVFNGEIYNHRALRTELAAQGAVFRSDHSDTEVLLHAYAQWGEGMVPRLDGMFAFALYDRHRHRILFARDRFGKKPLYYAVHARGIVFASELTALRRHPSVAGHLDRDALVRFFALGYVPAPRTLIAGASKLEAGDLALYDVATGSLEVRPYWRYRIAAQPLSGSAADWIEELQRLLRAGVERRLEADVPLGFFLSGGIDSAAVLALACQLRGAGTAQAFTVGFEDPSYDEVDAARATAAALGVRHHHQRLSLDASRGLLGTLLESIDEPVSDPSLLPTHLLSRFARTQVTVALSGDGGDEMFAGYDTFTAMTPARLYYAAVPRALHRALRRAVEWLPRRDSNLSLDFKLRRALRGVSYPPPVWAAQWMAPADLDQVSAICRSPVAADAVYDDVIALWNSCASDDPRDRLLEFYARFYLTGDILAKVDRASMLTSLEVRCPLLDTAVAEFCMRLPYRAKHRHGERKWIFRRAVEGLLPPDVLRRPKKGFGIPIAAWLRQWPIPDLGRAEEAGLDAGHLARLWSEHREGRADHRGVLFAWLSLDRWMVGPRAVTADAAPHLQH